MRKPTVKLEMTTFPFFIDVGADLDEAEALMKEHDIGHLPVKRDGELVGILALADLRLAELAGEERVALLYRSDPYVVDLDAPLDVVVEGMAERHTDVALVVREGKLAGILTTYDVCKVLARILRGGGEPDPEPDVA